MLGHFEERMKNYTDEDAVEEANRCMSCGMCFECDNCVVYCPQDAVFRVKKMSPQWVDMLTRITPSVLDVIYVQMFVRQDTSIWHSAIRVYLKMRLFRDSYVSNILESSCMHYTLRFCVCRFLALTKNPLLLDTP